MANMSYCRWENTSADMQDCVQAQKDGFEVQSANEYEAQGYYAALRAAAEMLALADPTDLQEMGMRVADVDAVQNTIRGAL